MVKNKILQKEGQNYLWSFLLIALYCGFGINILAATGSVSGLVTDSRTRMPLVGVNVFLLGTELGTATNNQGQYRITEIPEGKYKIEVSMIGYEPIQRDIEVRSGTEIRMNFNLKQTTIPVSEIVVTPGHFGMKRESDAPDQIMSVEEIKKTAGIAGDAVMAMHTMPGIISIGPTAPIYVQGGNLDENLILFDRGTVAAAYHCDIGGGGMYSIFNSAILREVNLYTGGFPAEYGGKLSSVLDIETRAGDMDRFKGSASLSMSSAELVCEGPLTSKGSFILSARRSYFDFLIKLSGWEDPFVVPPNYYDLSGRLTFNLSPNQQIFLSTLWASDNMIMRFEDSENLGNLNWRTDKGLWTLRLNSISGDKFLNQFSFSQSSGLIRMERWQWRYNTDEISYALREDLTIYSIPNHKLKFGLLITRPEGKFDISWPRQSNDQENESKALPVDTIDGTLAICEASGYLQDQFKVIGNLIANLGLRFKQRFDNYERMVSPRIGLAYALTEASVLRAAWGHYYQSPDIQKLLVNYGNPDLKAKKAEHYILGIEHELTKNILFRLEAYYKHFSHLPLFDPDLGFSNQGKGYSRGLAFFIQRHLGRFSGWASYTYTYSRRRENWDTVEVYPHFDRRHIATAVVNYDLGHNWRIGFNWMYASGRPVTPLEDVVYDSIIGAWRPIWGPTNSERFPSYLNLDIRILRDFKFSHWNLALFIEVLNTFNHKNVAGYAWNEDYTERQTLTYYGILPTIGFIAKF